MIENADQSTGSEPKHSFFFASQSLSGPFNNYVTPEVWGVVIFVTNCYENLGEYQKCHLVRQIYRPVISFSHIIAPV